MRKLLGTIKSNTLKIYYFVFNTIFKTFYSNKDFSIKYKGQKITIFLNNHKFQKNKPTPLRLIDGTYEKNEIKSIQRLINKDDVVLELGGSIGVTSTIIGSILDNSSNLVVCEGNPNLISNLKYNKEQNNLNFSIIDKPVSNEEKEVLFNFNGLSLSGSIINKTDKFNEVLHGSNKSLGIYTTTPTILEKQLNKKFNVLVCDIEGEEYSLLNGLYDYFNNFRLLMVEFHYYGEYNESHRKSLEKKFSQFFEVWRISHNVTCFMKQ